jgi:hypothetical protein
MTMTLRRTSRRSGDGERATAVKGAVAPDPVQGVAVVPIPWSDQCHMWMRVAAWRLTAAAVATTATVGASYAVMMVVVVAALGRR